jgi:hypothetical protein
MVQKALFPGSAPPELTRGERDRASVAAVDELAGLMAEGRCLPPRAEVTVETIAAGLRAMAASIRLEDQ